jgi:acyl carrier protein
MTTQDIQQIVLSSLNSLGYDAKNVLPVHDLQSDLGLDSTEVVELAALVRNQCGLKAQRLDFKSLKTVSDLASQVEALLSQPAAAGPLGAGR